MNQGHEALLCTSNEQLLRVWLARHLDRCTSNGSRLHAACVAALLARHLSLLILQYTSKTAQWCCLTVWLLDVFRILAYESHLLVRLAELHGPCNLCRALAIMKQRLGLLVQEQKSLRD